MNLSKPTPLDETHDCSLFACGEAALDKWLRERAIKNQRFGASRTYVTCRAGAVVGYYALAAGGIDTSDVSGRFRRNMPDPIPVIILGRLAIDRTMQGHGLGRALLQDAGLRVAEAANIVGIRGIAVRALNGEASNFYRAIGFDASPADPMTLAITLDDLMVSINS